MPLHINTPKKNSDYKPKAVKDANGKKAKVMAVQKLRDQYIRMNLEPGRMTQYTLTDLARETGVNYDMLCDHAKAGGWRDMVEQLWVEIGQQRQRQLIASSLQTEQEIRERQAKMARALQDKAMLRIMSLNPDEIPVKEVFRMLQVGIQEERRALGMVDSVTGHKDLTPPSAANPISDPLQEALTLIQQHRQQRLRLAVVNAEDATNVRPSR